MADDSQIIAALRKLSTYYGKEPSKDQAHIYVEMLRELEPAALNFAVQQWILQSPFFPRISELFQKARQYQPPPLSPIQALSLSQRLLEQKFWRQGELDPQEWERLAARFELYGCEAQASRCRSRLQQCQEQIALEKEPEKWKTTCAQNRQKWLRQADLLQRYYNTGELPESWR